MNKTIGLNAALLLLILAALTGCKSDDEEDTSLSLLPESYAWTSDINQQAMTINTKGKWSVRSSVDWCQPAKSTGSGDYQLRLWVTPNITSAARTGTLTVSTNGTTRSITLSQPAFTGSTDEYVYRLPVICHVLYDKSTDRNKYVTKGRMAEIIEQVNELYANNNMNVAFEMAEIDENGDSIEEPGVIREEVSFDTISALRFLDESSKYGKYNQNFQRYINIFVFKYAEESTLGVSDLPVMPTERKMDGLSDQAGADLQTFTTLSFPWGVTINNEYIYEDPEEGYIKPLNVVLTLAHELGHYLGLLHTFSEDECNEDDYCSDTKNCDYYAYTDELVRIMEEAVRTGKQLTGNDVLVRTNCEDGETYMAHNILDYMYTVGDSLSSQQYDRTRQVLYYCPMVPGPKLETYSTRRSAGGESDRPLLPRLSNCPALPATGSLNKKSLQ